MSTWADLRVLREAGKKPGMRLIVATWFRAELAELGCMVIVHKAGERVPFELLRGLDVLLMLNDCGQAQKLRNACVRKGITATIEAWCRCDAEIVRLPIPCEQASYWREAIA